MSLGSTRVNSEAGNHFVENEQLAVFISQCTQSRQKLAANRNLAPVATRRFKNDCANFGVALELMFNEIQVVGRNDHRLVGDPIRNTRNCADFIWRVGARHDEIVPAMEMTDELQHFGTAGKKSRQSQRHQRGLGPARRKADSLRAGNEPLDPFSPFDFQVVARSVMGALGDLLLDCGNDLGRRMSEHQGTVAIPEVDQFVLVDIPFARSERVCDIDGERLKPPRVVRHAVGKNGSSFLESLTRTGKLGFEPLLKSPPYLKSRCHESSLRCTGLKKLSGAVCAIRTTGLHSSEAPAV